VRARYGPRYSAVVLRPLAEQLLGMFPVRAGQTACDLLCDSGVLTAALARAVAPQGAVIAADVSADLVKAAYDAATHGTAQVRTCITDGVVIPLKRHSCDVVASLLTLGFGDPGALITEARQIVSPGGAMAIMHWDASIPPEHENALVRSLSDCAGYRSPFLDSVLSQVLGNGHTDRIRVRDVVRFDGFTDYWHACVAERPLGDELTALTDELIGEVQAHTARALERFTAADGSLRIPVEALVVTIAATRRRVSGTTRGGAARPRREETLR